MATPLSTAFEPEQGFLDIPGILLIDIYLPAPNLMLPILRLHHAFKAALVLGLELELSAHRVDDTL